MARPASRLNAPFVTTIRVETGWLRFSPIRTVEVGDMVFPELIEADFPGEDGSPGLLMYIGVVNGSPRLVDATLYAHDDGLPLRPKDFAAVAQMLDVWVDQILAICAGEITQRNGPDREVAYPANEAKALKVARSARSGERRRMTPERLGRIAEVYESAGLDGLDAVTRAFQVARSTAATYVRQARDAGLIEDRRKPHQRGPSGQMSSQASTVHQTQVVQKGDDSK